MHIEYIKDTKTYFTQSTKSPGIVVLSRMKNTPLSRSFWRMLLLSSRVNKPIYQLTSQTQAIWKWLSSTRCGWRCRNASFIQILYS